VDIAAEVVGVVKNEEEKVRNPKMKNLSLFLK
jgi:hypothetical protein